MSTKPRVDLTGIHDPIEAAHEAVLVHSLPLSTSQTRVSGFNQYESTSPITVTELLTSFESSGFQASHLGKAAQILKDILRWRLSDDPASQPDNDTLDFSWDNEAVRQSTRATIFLSFTSNMISSGLREAFVYLAKHRLVDVIVTTAGGIEEDFIKCLGDSAIGSFRDIPGRDLRAKGWNRIGNIYVPNDNYVKFEAWLQPILDSCLEKQKSDGTVWTPASLVKELGREINDESSLYYWCYKNDIPVYCPSFSDGSIGDNLYFHASRNPGLIVDIVKDIAAINRRALISRKTGIVILGGGAAKHHVCNANLMRNGADAAIYINTAQEFDGSDSGAAPDEAISWGKIKATAATVKVCIDATIAFPLLVASVMKAEVAHRQREQLPALPPQWCSTKEGYVLHAPWHKG